MKKKALTVVLTLTMAATMFAGCGDKKTTGTTETTEAVSTEDEKDDQAKADEVAALIDAIYVQERTDETDAQCKAAKEAWDALTDAQKELVSGENADPDYFGRDTGDASKDDPLNADDIGENELLVVSFGTSFEEALPAIVNIEETCKKAFPDYDFYRAFTSGMIIRKWARTKNVIIHNPDEVMKRLVAEGYEEVICQPTHIINGLEYDKMMNMLLAYKDQIPTIKVGTPLLTEEEDYKEACEIVMQELEKPLAKDEAFVFMGHGTEHFANSAYSQFENMLRDLGHESTYVGTVEGFPSLDYVIRRLKIREIKKVYVMPLMIVAGDHARNDLAGAEADSWDSILKADGFETEVIMKGLGEIDAIAEMFVKHLKKAESL